MRYIISLLVFFVSGCATNGGFSTNTQSYSPKHYSENKEFDELRLKIKGKPKCDAIKTESCYNKDDRDELLTTGMSVINKNYKEYIDDATSARAGRSFLSDAFALIFSTTSTVIAPVASKSIFSGLSAATLGSKSAYEKSFF